MAFHVETRCRPWPWRGQVLGRARAAEARARAALSKGLLLAVDVLPCSAGRLHAGSSVFAERAVCEARAGAAEYTAEPLGDRVGAKGSPTWEHPTRQALCQGPYKPRLV